MGKSAFAIRAARAILHVQHNGSEQFAVLSLLQSRDNQGFHVSVMRSDLHWGLGPKVAGRLVGVLSEQGGKRGGGLKIVTRRMIPCTDAMMSAMMAQALQVMVERGLVSLEVNEHGMAGEAMQVIRSTGSSMPRTTWPWGSASSFRVSIQSGPCS